MRIPSRRMPQVQPKCMGIVGWGCLLASAASLLYAAYAFLGAVPWLVMPAIRAFAWLSSRETDQRKRQLEAVAQSRSGQSICEFARDVDARHVDTWVVRAVYEQLQASLSHACPNFPIRGDDLLEEPLLDDPDELDFLLAPEIAERTGRSLDAPEQNPYYAKVRTARDLVMFFNAQPMQLAASH